MRATGTVKMPNGYQHELDLGLPETDPGCPLDQFLLAVRREQRLRVWMGKKQPTIQIIPGPDWISDCMVWGP